MKTAAAVRSGIRSAHTPGKIEDGTTGDRANEHYHRYKEDIGLINGTRREGLPVFDRVAAGVS